MKINIILVSVKKVNFLRKNYILVYSSGYNKEIFNKNMRHHQYRVFLMLSEEFLKIG